MNTDIDESDCIVIQKGGGKIGKQSVEFVGSKDPTDTGASVPSVEAGERAEDGRGGWTIVTRRQAKAGRTGNSSLLTTKPTRVFASTSKLEQKQKAQQSLVD